MQLTLQITTGPHAGRKISLRSGQVARIGRTEWADFSFPRDAELADVHFAVQCQLHGAKLRKLAADRPLALNAAEISEAELQPGDTIQAGQSAFIVAFDGQTTARAAAATVAGAAVAGAVAGQDGPQQPSEPTAVEIAEQLQLGAGELALAQTVNTGSELVALLAAGEAFAKAVRVQAHLLPKRQAVWWGLVCVEAACGNSLALDDAEAKEAARAWTIDPSENHRRGCETAAGRTKLDGPGSWLAMAAFWSGGSIAPEEIGAVVPDEKLTGQAVTSSLMIAAVSGDATQAANRYRSFLALARDVASGKNRWPDRAQ